MVDFIKRAVETGDIDPDEQVLAASNVTPSPFMVANAGMTGGLIAGGVVGAVVGAAWDRRRRKKDEQETATRVFPDVAHREPMEPSVPANGALLAVTTKRVIVWGISAMGTPRVVLVSVPLATVDQVVWEDADAKWLGGKPASLAVWIGVGDMVLGCAGIAMGPAGKWIRGVVEAFDQRLPGRVQVWSA